MFYSTACTIITTLNRYSCRYIIFKQKRSCMENVLHAILWWEYILPFTKSIVFNNIYRNNRKLALRYDACPSATCHVWCASGTNRVIQASTIRSPNVSSMLIPRLRRWPNIEPTLAEHALFAGIVQIRFVSLAAWHGRSRPDSQERLWRM